VKVVFFRDLDDGHMVFAVRGPFAHGGLFISWLDDTEPEWEALIPESPRWDSFHQMIFRAHRAEVFDVSELPPSLRSVPAMPTGPFPSAESYLAPEAAIPAGAYARVAALASPGPVEVWVVLHEDLYETKLGDGRFHYMRSVHLSEVAARAEMANPGEWEAFHLRTVAIEVEDGVFVFPGFAVQTYDHHKPEKVLEALEEVLSLP